MSTEAKKTKIDISTARKSPGGIGRAVPLLAAIPGMGKCDSVECLIRITTSGLFTRSSKKPAQDTK